jgi:hypothetical protein
MRSRVLVGLALLTVAAGCTKESNVATIGSDASHSVCALPAIHAAYDGKRAQVRGRFDAHAHGVFLKNERCPGYVLTLERISGGPDVSLCTPKRLAQEFGCPGGNQNGPVVTVVGILKPSQTPEYGTMLVSEIYDFENARTGERFTP